MDHQQQNCQKPRAGRDQRRPLLRRRSPHDELVSGRQDAWLLLAFSTESGAGELRNGIIGAGQFDGADKRFLIGIQEGVTQPDALRRLQGFAASAVRVPFGLQAPASPTLRHRRSSIPSSTTWRTPQPARRSCSPLRPTSRTVGCTRASNSSSPGAARARTPKRPHSWTGGMTSGAAPT